VAFIISHPFQYQFYASIAEKLNEPVFVLEGRVKTPFSFSEDFVSRLPGSVIRLDTTELIALDGLVDVIFCMTPVHVLTIFKASKVVALQYSLAKEIYQYGPWRIAAHLNLMHGQYSHERVVGFCASEIVGNPRYDNFTPSKVGGGGILYMPTYGELSSLPNFVENLSSLPPDKKILVKLHHASEFSDAELTAKLESDPRVELIDGYANALEYIAHADVVISDYSGAVFDALYLNRPVVLFQPPVQQTLVRTEEDSIEIAKAEFIGPVARSFSELLISIERAIVEQEKWAASRALLRSQIFAYEGRSSDRIVEVLSDLMKGGYDPPSSKRELRKTYIRYLEDNRRLRAAANPKNMIREPVKEPVTTTRENRKPLFANFRKRVYRFFKR
jgi:hypothetical protein